jgi:hypothetical protein
MPCASDGTCDARPIEGWEPAAATDFPALWALARVQFEQYHRVLDLLLGGTTFRYRAVTIRLRRLVP